MVNQGDQELAGQGGEELHLEDASPQFVAGVQRLAQAWHGLGDGGRRRRKVLEQDGPPRTGVEHGVVHAAVVVPQAEFRAHAVGERCGGEHLRLRQAERGEVGLEACELLGELGVVLRGIKGGQGHGVVAYRKRAMKQGAAGSTPAGRASQAR